MTPSVIWMRVQTVACRASLFRPLLRRNASVFHALTAALWSTQQWNRPLAPGWLVSFLARSPYLSAGLTVDTAWTWNAHEWERVSQNICSCFLSPSGRAVCWNAAHLFSCSHQVESRFPAVAELPEEVPPPSLPTHSLPSPRCYPDSSLSLPMWSLHLSQGSSSWAAWQGQLWNDRGESIAPQSLGSLFSDLGSLTSAFTARPYNQRQKWAAWGRSEVPATPQVALRWMKCHVLPVLGECERDIYRTAEESSLQGMGKRSSHALPSLVPHLPVRAPVREITSHSFESFFHTLVPTPSGGAVGGKLNSDSFRGFWAPLCCCAWAWAIFSLSLTCGMPQ